MTAEIVNPEVLSPTPYSPISVIANETRVAHPNVTATVLIMRSGADDQGTTFLTPFNTGISPETVTTNNSNLAVGALARMSPEERATFAAMLQHILVPDMSRSAAPSRSESVVTAPPPYT